MHKTKPVIVLALLLGACQSSTVPPAGGQNPTDGGVNNPGGGNNNPGGGNNNPGGGNNNPGGGNNPDPTPNPGTDPSPGNQGDPVTRVEIGAEPANPRPEQWVRSNLHPEFEMLEPGDFGTLDRLEFSITNQEFTVPAGTNVGVSIAQKMQEIQQDVLPDRNNQRQIITSGNDRIIAENMAFRGKPSDVKFLRVNNQTKVFVPLGGLVSTPGNEVSIVTLDADGTPVGNPELVEVGLRPQRVAIHPADLVFVCNQYSNYISVIDPTTEEVLQVGGEAVEIPTDHYCSDIAFTRTSPQNNDDDEQFMFVSNRYRNSILKYDVRIERDPLNNRPSNVISTLVDEYTGVCPNPYRLSVSEQQNQVFCTSNRGGVVGSLNVQTEQVRSVFMNAPVGDIINIENRLFMPGTTNNRGQLTNQAGAQLPQELAAQDVIGQGLDGQSYVIYPGVSTDTTNSYLFEDARGGIFQTDVTFNNLFYYTDNSSGEANFSDQQKIIDGGLPWGIARDAAGTRIWVTMSGERKVQEFNVVAGAQVSLSDSRTLNTNHRPLAAVFDDENELLYVSTYMGETLDVFDISDDNALDPIQRIDLGYADPIFPASNYEVGELFFNDTAFSNNGDKSCVTCHYDEMDVDGVPFVNGTSSPLSIGKKIPSQQTLGKTGPWFWNGGMGNGNYTSTAFSFQTRTNCEMIQFAFTEGPDSDAATRIGDPFNFTFDEQIQQEVQDNALLAQLIDPEDLANLNSDLCRPEDVVLGQPGNADEINDQTALQKRIAAAVIQARSLDIIGEEAAAALGFDQGVERTRLAFAIDTYSNGDTRRPPTPTNQLWINGQLSDDQEAVLERGEQLFSEVGCDRCHVPEQEYVDFRNHGTGADWLADFARTFGNDQQLVDAIGQFEEPFTNTIEFQSNPDDEVGPYNPPITGFNPICPITESCLKFDDPIAAQGENRDRLLALQIAVNLADEERKFLPGQPESKPSSNTPSIRSVWSKGPAYMNHGLPKNIAQAILPSGHELLEGATGYNMDRFGNVGGHGTTQNLSAEDATALIMYVNSIP